MKLLKFDSYEDYVRIQVETNQEKLSKIWVSDKELYVIARYIKKQISDASFGICHGVRNGYEVQRLRDLLRIKVIGTDISDTAASFENVIQWDFHETKSEWMNNVDFIYSNSWDHSYDPELMLRTWMNCIKPNGRCFLHWTPSHAEEAVNGADCFGASLEELQKLVVKNFEIENILVIREWLQPRRSAKGDNYLRLERLMPQASLFQRLQNLLRWEPFRTIHLMVIKHKN